MSARDGLVLADLEGAAVEAALAPHGVPAHVARQIRKVVLRQGVLPSWLPTVGARRLDVVRPLIRIPRLRQEARHEARDGFVKYLFRTEGAEGCFEAVRIPLLHVPGDEKYVVCISSQVGCALGCVFCATGRLGFVRNLATWEMVDQVVQVAAEAPHPVAGVVFMGMGEPLLNYEAVMRAARIMAEPCGLAISGKAITISTAGIAPAIRRMAEERLPFRLVVSLTSADPAQRGALMPVERRHPLAELREALQVYHNALRRRVTLAWIMVDGVNVGEEQARALAAWTAGLPVKIDLLDVNDPDGVYRPPSDAGRNAFHDALRKHLAAPVARRYSGGAEIRAACGMLAGNGWGAGALR
jgi:23S rRNA (adenine2503-C2)-methyltransferase